MSDIQPGDVVVCVTVSLPGYKYPTTRLAVGRLYRVEDVYISSKSPSQFGLVIRGASPRVNPGFNSRLFRKIRPADPEFIELIKRVSIPA